MNGVSCVEYDFYLRVDKERRNEIMWVDFREEDESDLNFLFEVF